MDVSGNWFKDWFGSPYYSLLYCNKQGEEGAAFIKKMVDFLSPAPDSFMMDVGCGTGRLAKILASYAFDVTGIDLSEENIIQARIGETDTLHFFQHDMRLPFWINYFNYTFNLFTSFGYFRTEREHNNAIRTIANSLKPGGVLVLDYLNTYYAEENMVGKEDKEIDGTNFHLASWHDETHFYKKIIVVDDRLPKPLVFQEKIVKFTLRDFNNMFGSHNLQIQHVFGNYDLQGYDSKSSPRLVMVAEKV